MKPNTFHYVVTLENSVTIGRHFYCTSTILQSVIGIVHTFLMGHAITNVHHQDDLQSVLRRIMGLWYMRYNESSYSFDDHHTPDISTPDGLHDFMALGNLMELGRVLDRRTYTDKGISKKEGAEIIAGRRWFRTLQTMIACKFQICVGGRPMNTASVFKRSLVEFAAAILSYKREIDMPQEERLFHSTSVEKEMKKFFRLNYPELVGCWERLISERFKHLSWSGENIQIAPRRNLDSWNEYYNFNDLKLYDIEQEAELSTHLETIPEDGVLDTEMEVFDLNDGVVTQSKTTTKPHNHGPPIRSSKRIQERAASVGKLKGANQEFIFYLILIQSHQLRRSQSQQVHRNQRRPRRNPYLRLHEVSMPIIYVTWFNNPI
jgi:hypothetical protein